MDINHQNPRTILVPPYYANAHLCLSKICIFHYKWSYKGVNILTQINKKTIRGMIQK